jgi:hypothetical protein
VVSRNDLVNTFRLWKTQLIDWSAPLLVLLIHASLWAQEKQETLPLIKRLDGPRRAKVLAALAALVILGFAMVILAWLGARVTRRYMRSTSYFRSTPRPERSDWSPQPLKPGDKLVDEPDEETS